MILVDANILIYSTTAGPHHARARHWLDGQFTAGHRVGFPWLSLAAFLRIVTNTRMYGAITISTEVAWGQVESWLACPNVWIPAPGELHAATLKRTLQFSGSGGNHVTDAHLAAIAIEHGLTLCSADRGFARFKGLKWMDPLDE